MVKILIVDDDAALREGLAETVADLGHAPRTAAPAARRWRRLPRDVRCVLLDLRMPGGMDGIEVLRRIRAQRQCAAGRGADGVCDAPRTPSRRCGSARSTI